MDRNALLAWAEEYADGPVTTKRDNKLSLSSKLLRFPWNGAMCVAVGSDADGKTRINAVLDAVALLLDQPESNPNSVHLLVGVGPEGQRDPKIREHLDAIGTLVSELRGPTTVRVWVLAEGAQPVEFATRKCECTTNTPENWPKMLMTAALTPVTGMAVDVVRAMSGYPSFALYQKLTSQKSAEPWQMRLDGLAIGLTGPSRTTLRLASKDLTKLNEPGVSWNNVVGPAALYFAPDQIGDLIELIDKLVARWSSTSLSGAVLAHGQAEHALEAHVLSGRLILNSSGGPLRLAVPMREGMIASAQFPTLWGNDTPKRHYLDALLADDQGRPWAIELKDQDAGGGHGFYLRHGIGQAVLYRHYIRSTAALEPWFQLYGLKRTECQAALSFPTAAVTTSKKIERLRSLADLYDIEVIEFKRPG